MLQILKEKIAESSSFWEEEKIVSLMINFLTEERVWHGWTVDFFPEKKKFKLKKVRLKIFQMTCFSLFVIGLELILSA